MAINNGIGRVWAANAGDEGRPAGVGPVWIENIDAITPSGSGGSTYTGGNGIDVDNDNDIISLDDEAQAAIDSYVTNSGSFITSADVPGVKDLIAGNGIDISATSSDVTISVDDAIFNGYATETWVSGQGYMKNVFVAQYGISTFDEVKAAFLRGDEVFCEVASQYDQHRMAILTYANLYDQMQVPYQFIEFQYYKSNRYLDQDDSVLIYQIHDDGTWSTTERTAGNVSDWQATSGKSQILNKPDMSTYATQTWSTNSFFPIDGLQVVSSSAEASGANIIYIVSGSNA
jgi:hypothetical protein